MVDARAEDVRPGDGPDNMSTANPGLIDGVELLWNDLAELTNDHIELISLETQRVGESFVSIVIYGIVVSLLLVAAWLGLVSAFVLWLVHIGVIVSLAILISVLLNIAAAIGLVLLIRYESHNLRFSSTAQSIKSLYNLLVHHRE